MSDSHPDDKRTVTEKRLWNLFEKIKAEKRPTGPTDFAKEAGIDRSYLYKFRELVAEISAYGKRTQPGKSRRGAGVSKTEAKKRQITDQVRREHTQWAKELPKLRQKLSEAEDTIRTQHEEIEGRRDERDILRRACEHLMMLASEAGASPTELESLRCKLSLSLEIIAKAQSA
jgi:hypothetical protein